MKMGREGFDKMNLKLIRGKTFYLDLKSSLVGVYVFADKSCLLIDSSDRAGMAASILEAVTRAGLTVCGIINTHAHADHCAGNHRIQEATGCDIYASRAESYAINDPLVGLYCLYSANPIRVLKNRFLLAEPARVTQVVDPGRLIINGEPMEILDLKGHSLGQIGVITPDGVAFAGDSLINPAILDDFSFLYLADIEAQLKTLELLAENPPDLVFLTHGGIIGDLPNAIKVNLDLLNRIADYLKDILAVPLTREQVVQITADHFNLVLNRTQYFLISSSLSAFLSFLTDRKEIRCYTESNLLKFVRN